MVPLPRDRGLVLPPTPTRHHIVVCVDDDPAILRAIERLLRREPYELRTTSDPYQALRWVERDRVSLMMVDQRMPILNGTDLVARSAASSTKTIHLVLTAYPDSDLMRDRIEGRIRRILNKPWDDLELMNSIREILVELEQRDEAPHDGPVTAPAPVDEVPSPRPKWEIVIGVDCRGRSSYDVLRRVVPRLRNAESEGASVLVAMENVGAVKDSVPFLIRELIGEALNSRVRVTFSDRTGTLCSYLDSLGQTGVSVEQVCSSQGDPPGLA